jgi:ferredoxin
MSLLSRISIGKAGGGNSAVVPAMPTGATTAGALPRPTPARRVDAAASRDVPARTILQVDWVRCQGHGVCAAAFGEKISLDRWGFPAGVTTSGVPVPDGLEGPAKLAVATCPAVALRLRDAQTD